MKWSSRNYLHCLYLKVLTAFYFPFIPCLVSSSYPIIAPYLVPTYGRHISRGRVQYHTLLLLLLLLRGVIPDDLRHVAGLQSFLLVVNDGVFLAVGFLDSAGFFCCAPVYGTWISSGNQRKSAMARGRIILAFCSFSCLLTRGLSVGFDRSQGRLGWM